MIGYQDTCVYIEDIEVLEEYIRECTPSLNRDKIREMFNIFEFQGYIEIERGLV